MKTRQEFLNTLVHLPYPRPCNEGMSWLRSLPNTVRTVDDIIMTCDRAHWLCWVTNRFKRPVYESWALKHGSVDGVYPFAFMAYAYRHEPFYGQVHRTMLKELRAIWVNP